MEEFGIKVGVFSGGGSDSVKAALGDSRGLINGASFLGFRKEKMAVALKIKIKKTIVFLGFSLEV